MLSRSIRVKANPVLFAVLDTSECPRREGPARAGRAFLPKTRARGGGRAEAQRELETPFGPESRGNGRKHGSPASDDSSGSPTGRPSGTREQTACSQAGDEHRRGTNAASQRLFYPEAIRPHSQVLRTSTGLGLGLPARGATLKNIIIV